MSGKSFFASVFGSVTKNSIFSLKNVNSLFGGIWYKLSNLDKVFLDGKGYFSLFLKKTKTPAKNNYDLGLSYFKKEDYSGAVMRFKLANMFGESDESHYYLVRSYIALGKFMQAKRHLKILNTKNSEIEGLDYFYNLIVAENQGSVVFPSSTLITEYFDVLSAVFDAMYVKHYEYKGYEKMFDSFKEYYDKKHVHKNIDQSMRSQILEIGCGRGVLGTKIKEQYPSVFLEGVDISGKMLLLSQKRTIVKNVEDDNSNFIIDNENNLDITRPVNVYSRLIKKDINDIIGEYKRNTIDFIITRGLISYIKDLDYLFSNIANILKVGGCFMFFLIEEQQLVAEERKEVLYGSYPFFLRKELHDEAEISELTDKYSFMIEKIESFTIEKKKEARLYVVKKI